VNSRIHWVTDKATGKFYGTGFITFATVDEAKEAVKKHDQEVLGRPIRIDFAQARAERGAGGSGGFGGTFQNKKPFEKRASAGAGGFGSNASKPVSEKPDGCTTVFLGNLNFNVDEAAVRGHFADCGEITAIRWVERDGKFSGCGFVEFGATDATDKAVALNGSSLMDRQVRVDYSAARKPRY